MAASGYPPAADPGYPLAAQGYFPAANQGYPGTDTGLGFGSTAPPAANYPLAQQPDGWQPMGAPTTSAYGSSPAGYGAPPGNPPPGQYLPQQGAPVPSAQYSAPVGPASTSMNFSPSVSGTVPTTSPARPDPSASGNPAHGQATDKLAGDFARMTTTGTAEHFEGTVKPAANFNVEADTESIRKAMKGAGTDEQTIIDLVRQRSNAQRQEIKKMFKTMYGKDLIKDLQSELSGDFREAIMALFVPTTYYDAWTLEKAMSGLGTKESVLIEILCTRTNAEIREIVRCYKEHFRRDLEKDIVGDTSGHFKRLLVSCCQGNRAELTPAQWNDVFTRGPESVVDRALAKKEAEDLYKAGEKKIGTDESAFLKVMALRHFYQLRATFEEYARISQRDILNSISREMSGDLESGFKALVMSARNRPEYFADRLYKSMKGAGTNDSQLIRIIVTRSEVDMKQIKQVFFQKYKKTLAKWIEQDTSGDYRRILVGLVGYDF